MSLHFTMSPNDKIVDGVKVSISSEYVVAKEIPLPPTPMSKSSLVMGILCLVCVTLVGTVVVVGASNAYQRQVANPDLVDQK